MAVHCNHWVSVLPTRKLGPRDNDLLRHHCCSHIKIMLLYVTLRINPTDPEPAGRKRVVLSVLLSVWIPWTSNKANLGTSRGPAMYQSWQGGHEPPTSKHEHYSGNRVWAEDGPQDHGGPLQEVRFGGIFFFLFFKFLIVVKKRHKMYHLKLF